MTDVTPWRHPLWWIAFWRVGNSLLEPGPPMCPVTRSRQISSCSCANLKSTAPTTAGTWSGDQESCRESTDQEDRGTPSRRDRQPVHQGGGSRSDEASRRADCDRVEQRGAERTADLRRGVDDRRGHACLAWVDPLGRCAEGGHHHARDTETEQYLGGHHERQVATVHVQLGEQRHAR